MFFALQGSQPYIVTVVQEPARQTTIGDLIVASLGLTSVLVLLAAVLGAGVAFLLVRWRRRHPPELDHLPPVSPLVADPGAQRSSQAR